MEVIRRALPRRWNTVGFIQKLLATKPVAMASSPSATDTKLGKPKLHGRAFYDSIGSPKFVLAPMVDQSEFVRFLSEIIRIALEDIEC